MSESEVTRIQDDAACAVAGAAAICWAGDEDWVPPEWEADDWLDSDPASDPDDTAAWLRGLPADVREDLLAGPYTGAGEAIPVGYTHRDGGRPGVGFAAGGLLDGLEPSAWLARALGETTAAGERELGESELIGVLCGWRRMQSWAAAGEAAAVRELVRRRDEQALASGSENAAEHVDDEIAAALTLTGRSAGRLLSVAVQLGRLPAVSEAMSRGAVDWAKASLFADELASVGLASAPEIAARLLPRAPAQTTGQLRAALRRAVLAADLRRGAAAAGGCAAGYERAGVVRAVGQLVPGRARTAGCRDDRRRPAADQAGALAEGLRRGRDAGLPAIAGIPGAARLA